MNAEQYLDRIKKIESLVRARLIEHARLVEIAEGIGSATIGERVQSTRNLHKSADAIGSYVDLEREIAEMEQERREILYTIERLPSAEYDVIYDLYVADKQYKEIAYERKRSMDWVRYHRQRGIDMIQAWLDER